MEDLLAPARVTRRSSGLQVIQMDCLPRCDIPLPEIGAARVTTNFNVCAHPAELTIRVIHEVRSVSTFLAGTHSVDSRSIGTEHWPLKLNVQFYEHSPEEYYAKACILTERTGQITCFMNSTFTKEALMGECGATRLGVSSSLSMLLLTMVMVMFFVVVGVGIVFFAHHVFVKISRANKSNRKFVKQPQCAPFLPSSIQTKKMSNDDDRLTVIEEEKEESSRLSPTPSTSGFDTDPRSFSFNSHEHRSPPVDTVASVRGSILQTFRPAPHAL